MKTNLNLFIRLVGFSVIASSALAVTPAWKIYTNANTGLPGNYIYSIAIDAQDNKWIAGDDPIWDEGGLSKFDGAKFTDYTNVDAKCPGHNLGNVKFDAQGNAWMASDVGLLMFDGTRVTTVWNTANAPIWPTNMVSDFAWDSLGNLSGHAGRCPDREGWAREVGRSTWTLWTTANGIPWGQPWDGVTSIEIDAQNNIYIGSEVARCCEVEWNGLDLDRPERVGQRFAVRPERRTLDRLRHWRRQCLDRVAGHRPDAPDLYIRLLTVDARPPGSHLGRNIHRLGLEMERIELEGCHCPDALACIRPRIRFAEHDVGRRDRGHGTSARERIVGRLQHVRNRTHVAMDRRALLRTRWNTMDRRQWGRRLPVRWDDLGRI